MFRSFPILVLMFILQSACAREFQATPITLADRSGPGDTHAGIR